MTISTRPASQVPYLPRIACFHGGGSNADIFAVQCARLQAILRDDFEFVYFDAPFERGPGPGVLPYFHDYAPYKSWFAVSNGWKEYDDGSGYDELGTGGLERVWQMMEEEGEGGPWVAAMGFSQGTRVVGGLLQDQQRWVGKGVKRDFALRFGVLCMGSREPMQDESAHSKSDHDLITIPTLHLHGLKDVNLKGGRSQLATFFDRRSTRLYEIDYHHAMPWVPSELHRFAYLIKKMYKDTQGDDDFSFV